MSKKTSILFLLGCLLFVACKKEVFVSEEARTNLVGRWLMSYTTEEYIDGVLQAPQNVIPLPQDLELRGDGTFKQSGFLESTGTWFYLSSNDPPLILLNYRYQEEQRNPALNRHQISGSPYEEVFNSPSQHIWQGEFTYTDSLGVEYRSLTTYTLTP